MDENDPLSDKMRSHLVTINGAVYSKFNLDIQYSIVIPRFILRANTTQS